MRKKLYTLENNILASTFGTPIYLILFVSDNCPNKCSHCWYTRDWKDRNLVNKSLGFDEIEKISKSIKYIRFLTITGGEAFLRDDIVDIVNVFNKNTKMSMCDIPTSGFNEELISSKLEKILKSNPNLPFRVGLSIDGNETTHNRIRNNKDAFQNAMKTLRSLKNFKTKFSNLDISIISTISEGNYEEANELFDFVYKELPDVEWSLNIMRSHENKTTVNPEVLDAYKNLTKRISDRMRNINSRNSKVAGIISQKNSLRREIIIDILEHKRHGGGCAAGSLGGVIFNDGDVRPCEVLESSMGNIRDFGYDLKKVWNSNKAKSIRSDIQESNCICTHECFLSVSVLIQPSCWYRLGKKVMGNI